MGFTHNILYQMKFRKKLYQQDRVLLSKVIFFPCNDEEAA